MKVDQMQKKSNWLINNHANLCHSFTGEKTMISTEQVYDNKLPWPKYLGLWCRSKDLDEISCEKQD